MSELLPALPGLAPITNDERRRAALSVAELNHFDPERVCEVLLTLGLARRERTEDVDVLRSTEDDHGVTWFQRRATTDRLTGA